MVKNKSKPKKRGVDFKKIKRKIGRKLPPPQNATNTEIKSKAIVLPEQSVAAEKSGLAVSKKGLTLKELLQQTSHHNAKVRKDALIGIKDILLKHPSELKLHKLAIIGKLLERIGDDDKMVRETLYQLFKSVIFPGCREDNQGPLVSLMTANIFTAVDHLSIDVRLMAFKFFDLILQYYPSSFTSYAEKILQKYEDILRTNKFLEDKGKLKSILTGLERCLSLLPCNEKKDRSSVKNDIPAHDILHAFEPEVAQEPIGFSDITKKLKGLMPILVTCFLDFMPLVHSTTQIDAQSCDCMQSTLQNIDRIVQFMVSGNFESQPDPQSIPPKILKKLWDVFPLNLSENLSGKDDSRFFIINAAIAKIFLQLSNWNHSPPALSEKILEFVESSLSAKLQSGKVLHEKHLILLVRYIPKLTMQISGDWRDRVLQAFTDVFKNCSPESSMKLACLSAIEEMLNLENSWLYLETNDSTLLDYQMAWIRDIPSLLILLEDKNPLCSKALLRLFLRLGQSAPMGSPISQEIDNIQYSLRCFYSIKLDQTILYGPFMRLTPDIQELAICCLYYFSFMDLDLLQSLITCCLCNELEPFIRVRILEVVHSAFRDGHIKIADYTSFLLTLVSRFQVYPEKESPVRRTFKSVTSIVCSYLSQIGDNYLVFQMMEKTIIDQICGNIPLDTNCALLRLLVSLDSKPTRLSERSIIHLSQILPQYLIDIVLNIKKDDPEATSVTSIKRRRYYLLPSFYMFYRSERLLTLVLDVIGSWVSEINSSPCSSDRSTRLCAIVSFLLDMYRDFKIRKILLSCKIQIETMLQNILILLSSEGKNLTLEERHKIQSAYDRLQVISRNEVAENVIT